MKTAAPFLEREKPRRGSPTSMRYETLGEHMKDVRLEDRQEWFALTPCPSLEKIKQLQPWIKR